MIIIKIDIHIAADNVKQVFCKVARNMRLVSGCFFIALLLVLLSLNSVQAQPIETLPDWPAVTSQNKPWTRWWWHGSSVNEEELTAAMEAYREAGLGGLDDDAIERHFIDNDVVDAFSLRIAEAEGSGGVRLWVEVDDQGADAVGG